MATRSRSLDGLTTSPKSNNQNLALIAPVVASPNATDQHNAERERYAFKCE